MHARMQPLVTSRRRSPGAFPLAVVPLVAVLLIGGGAVRGSPAKLTIVRVDWCKFRLDGGGVDVINIASNWLYPKRGG